MLICHNTVQMKPECYYDRWNTACYYATKIKDTMWQQHIRQAKYSMLLYYTDGEQARYDNKDCPTARGR